MNQYSRRMAQWPPLLFLGWVMLLVILTIVCLGGSKPLLLPLVLAWYFTFKAIHPD